MYSSALFVTLCPYRCRWWWAGSSWTRQQKRPRRCVRVTAVCICSTQYQPVCCKHPANTHNRWRWWWLQQQQQLWQQQPVGVDTSTPFVRPHSIAYVYVFRDTTNHTSTHYYAYLHITTHHYTPHHTPSTATPPTQQPKLGWAAKQGWGWWWVSAA